MKKPLFYKKGSLKAGMLQNSSVQNKKDSIIKQLVDNYSHKRK